MQNVKTTLNVDREIGRRVKIHAAEKETTVKKVVEKALQEYLEKHTLKI